MACEDVLTKYGGGPRVGGLMRMYIDDDATPSEGTSGAVASWLNAGAVTDLTIDDAVSEVEYMPSCGNARTGLPGDQGVTSVSFHFHYGIDVDTHNRLAGMKLDGEVRWCRFLSHGGPGGQGIEMPLFVVSYNHDQPLEGVAGYDIEMSLGYMGAGGTSFFLPAWVSI